MPNVLIVKCSKDDDDGEMARMAESINVYRKSLPGTTVRVVDLKELEGDFNRGFNECGAQDELIFTGHSRFFLDGTRYIPPADYKVRKLADRRVGGYTSEVIAAAVVAAIMACKVKSVMFCCCEIATSVDSHERDDGVNILGHLSAAREVVVGMPANPRALLESYRWMPDWENRVSLLFDISARVQSLVGASARDMKCGGTIVIKGLNGVGYIVSNQPDYLSFGQRYGVEYEKILKRQAKSKVFSGDDVFLNEFVLNYEKKKSAHVLGFSLDLDVVGERLRKAQR